MGLLRPFVDVSDGEISDPVTRTTRIRSLLNSNGTALVRQTSFLLQLKRIASRHQLILNPLSQSTSTAHHSLINVPVVATTGITCAGSTQCSSSGWRLNAECFAVQLNYQLFPSPLVGSESEKKISARPNDEWIHVCDVLFEYNQDKIVSCPDLVTELNNGHFDSLVQHVENLNVIYSVSGSNTDRSRAFMCLEAVEEDMAMLSRVRLHSGLSPNRSNFTDTQHPDVVARVNDSILGHYTPRSGGFLGQLTYLVTPAQASIYRAFPSRLPTNSKSTGPDEKPYIMSMLGAGSEQGMAGGCVARIGLRPSTSAANSPTHHNLHQLAFMPLVTLREDANAFCVPEFAQPDGLKCANFEAELVLYLDPPVPVPSTILHELESITGLPMVTVVNDSAVEDLVKLIMRRHNQQHLYGINTHVQLPNCTQHCYNVQSNVYGRLVTCIPFTCSNQLSRIISLLRTCASAATLFETFVVHPRQPIEKDETLTFNFKIYIDSVHQLRIQFDNPSDLTRTVQMKLELGQFQVESCCVHPALDDHKSDIHPTVSSSHNLTYVLARSHSIPLSLSWLLMVLGCPIHSKIPINLPLSTKDLRKLEQSSDQKHYHALSNPKLMENLRDMLNRARSQVIIQGATGTGGILSGADRCVTFDADPPALTSNLTSTTAPLAPVSASLLSVPQLPPGVLATPPPMLPLTSDSSSANIRYNAALTSAFCPPFSSSSSLSDTIDGGGKSSRAIRLDDLLVGSLSHPITSYEHSVGGNSISGRPSVAGSRPSGSRELLADCLASPSNLPSIHSSSSGFPQSSRISLTGNSIQTNSVLSIPGTFVPSTSRSSIGSLPNPSRSSSLGSGSMLVNLLNEDPIPASSQSHHPPHTPTVSQRLVQPPSTNQVIPPIIPGILDASREQYSALLNSATIGPGIGRLHSPLSSVSGSNPCFNHSVPTSQPLIGPTLTTSTPIQHTKATPAGGHGRLSTNSVTPAPPHLNKTKSVPPCVMNMEQQSSDMTTKKTRKRRRGSSGPNMSVTSVPPPALQSAKSHRPNDANPTSSYRSSHSGSSHSVSSSLLAGLGSPSATNVSNLHTSLGSSKSVYDFDDNPNSSFDLINPGPTSSSVSMTISSAVSSKLSSSNSSFSASNSSSLLSSSGTNSQMGPIPERTVERKTSLKVTIKTLPPQPSNRPSKVSSTSKTESGQQSPLKLAAQTNYKVTPNTQIVKKRKRRTIDDSKPSSYVLDTVQPAVLSTNSQISSDLCKSHKAGHLGAANHAATLIVKKQRKRRANHVGDKWKQSQHAVPPSRSEEGIIYTANHSSDVIQSETHSGMLDANVVSKSGLKTKLSQPLIPAMTYNQTDKTTNPVGRKRKKRAQPTTPTSFPNPSDVNPSSLYTFSTESNADQRCVDAKLIRPTHHHSPPLQRLPGLSVSSGQLKKSKTHHSNLGSHLSTPTSLTRNPSSSSSAPSVELIKGYKIPKKKTLQSNNRPETASANPVPQSSSELCEPPKDIVPSDLEQTTSTTGPSTPPQITVVDSTVQPSQLDLLNLNQCVQQQPQQRRQSARSIIDIVDKLRAKSTSGVPAMSSSVTAQTPTTIRSDCEDRTGSSAATADPVNMSTDDDPIQDLPTSDNIFEKFYAGTPASHPSDSIKTSTTAPTTPQPSDETSLDHPSAEYPLSPTNNASCTQVSRALTTSEPTELSRLPAQYELIKAQTDTPASPSDSTSTSASVPSTCKSANASSPHAASKVIPVSPTHEILRSPQKAHGTGRKHNTTKPRFPSRPMSSHSGDGFPQSGSNSGAGFPRYGVPRPNFLHRPVHPQATANTYQLPMNWQSGGMDYIGSMDHNSGAWRATNPMPPYSAHNAIRTPAPNPQFFPGAGTGGGGGAGLQRPTSALRPPPHRSFNPQMFGAGLRGSKK